MFATLKLKINKSDPINWILATSYNIKFNNTIDKKPHFAQKLYCPTQCHVL